MAASFGLDYATFGHDLAPTPAGDGALGIDALQLLRFNKAALCRVVAARCEGTATRQLLPTQQPPQRRRIRGFDPRDRSDQPLGVGMPRLEEYLPGRRVLDDATGIHDADPVGDLRQQRKIMGYVEHGEPYPRPHLVQEVEDLLLRGDVEAGGRFVQHKQVGIAGQRHGDADPLLLSAGQLMRIAPQEGGIVRQTHQRQGLRHPLARAVRGLGAAMHEDRLGDLRADADAGIERRGRVLRHEGDAVAPEMIKTAARHPGHRFTLEENRALLDLQARMTVAEELQGDGRLAAAGFTDQAEDLAGRDREADIVDCARPSLAAPIGDAEPADFDQRLAHAAH